MPRAPTSSTQPSLAKHKKFNSNMIYDSNMKKFLTTLLFSELDVWDMKRFSKSKITSRYPLVRLNTLIKQRSEKVKLYDFPEKEFGILGISQKKGIFDAYTQKGQFINQSYQTVQINDLAYNPWQINVGAIGWRTENQKNDFISPAYVVFECLHDFNPEFALRIFKTNTFQKIINDHTTGSVRQTLKYDSFKNIQIPLPP